MIILWLVKSGITMLSHNKDDNQFVSEFPSFLEHPVLWQISIHKSGLLLKLLSFRKRFDVSDVFIPILMYLTFLMFLYQSWRIWRFWCFYTNLDVFDVSDVFYTNLDVFDASDVFIPILMYLKFLMFLYQSLFIWRFWCFYTNLDLFDVSDVFLPILMYLTLFSGLY